MSLQPIKKGIPIPYAPQKNGPWMLHELTGHLDSRFYPEKTTSNFNTYMGSWRKTAAQISDWEFRVRPWEEDIDVDGTVKKVKGIRVWRWIEDEAAKGQGATGDDEHPEVPEPGRQELQIDVPGTLRKHSGPNR